MHSKWAARRLFAIMKATKADGIAAAHRTRASNIEPSPALRKLVKAVDAKRNTVVRLEERRETLNRDLHNATVQAATAQIKAGLVSGAGATVAETADMKSLKLRITKNEKQIEVAQKQLSKATDLVNKAFLKVAGDSEANMRRLAADLGIAGKPVPKNSELMNKALELIEELKAGRS